MISYKLFMEMSSIYNFRYSWGRDEHIRFWCQRSRSQREKILSENTSACISYKLLVGISPNLQFKCIWGQRLSAYILRSKGRRSRSQRKFLERHMISGSHWQLWSSMNVPVVWEGLIARETELQTAVAAELNYKKLLLSRLTVKLFSVTCYWVCVDMWGWP